MEERTLFKFLECPNIRCYSLPVEENSFKTDISSEDFSLSQTKISKKSFQKKESIASLFTLAFVLLFTNFLFAQQPACNLKGILESRKSIDGGVNFTINPDLHNVVPGTIYRWEFTSNTSGATIVSETNLPSLTVKPGDLNGNLNIKLTLINPATPFRPSRLCSCTKSVSIGNR